jgi:hypothetical protein
MARDIFAVGLRVDAHLNHIGVHLLDAALEQEDIGSSSIGPKAGTA